jgi:hypothetical protein
MRQLILFCTNHSQHSRPRDECVRRPRGALHPVVHGRGRRVVANTGRTGTRFWGWLHVWAARLGVNLQSKRKGNNRSVHRFRHLTLQTPPTSSPLSTCRPCPGRRPGRRTPGPGRARLRLLNRSSPPRRQKLQCVPARTGPHGFASCHGDKRCHRCDRGCEQSRGGDEVERRARGERVGQRVRFRAFPNPGTVYSPSLRALLETFTGTCSTTYIASALFYLSAGDCSDRLR